MNFFTSSEGNKEGLTLVSKHFGAVVNNDVLKAPGIRYEAEKFNYITDMNPGRMVLGVTAGSKYKTIDALKAAKGLKAGATSARGSFVTRSLAAIEVLGLDAKVITGYQGSNGLALAVARGEVDFMVGSEPNMTISRAAGHVEPLFVMSDTRSPALPDVPSWAELGVTIPPGFQSLFELLIMDGQAVAMPPGVPQDRVEYLRNIFIKLSDNKEVQNDVEKVAKPFQPFRSGDKLQDIVYTIKADAKLIDSLEALFAKNVLTK